jgi:hypothetical protein
LHPADVQQAPFASGAAMMRILSSTPSLRFARGGREYQPDLAGHDVLKTLVEKAIYP